jgi:hypothetical protein
MRKANRHLSYGKFISDYSDKITDLFFENMNPVIDKYLNFHLKNNINSIVFLNDDGSSPLSSELSTEEKNNLYKFNKLNNELNFISYKLDLLNFIETYKTNVTENTTTSRKKRYSLFTKTREDYLHTCNVCKNVNRVPINPILNQIHNELIDNYLIGNTIIIEGLCTANLTKKRLYTKINVLKPIKQTTYNTTKIVPALHTNKYLTKYKNYMNGKLFVVKDQDDFDYVKNLNIKEVIKQSGIEDYFKSQEMQTYLRTKIFSSVMSLTFDSEYNNQLYTMSKVANDVFDLETKDYFEICKNTVPSVLSMFSLESYYHKVIAKFNNQIIPMIE